jgi:mRNA interferase MazF
MSTVTTSGDGLPRRGEVWWVRVDKRRPVVVVQTDKVREPRVRSFLVVPLTSRLHLAGLPGNVRLDRGDTRLPKSSVANVYDVQKVLSMDFVQRVGSVPADRLAAIGAGLRLVLDLD